MTAILTTHSKERLKERCGLPKKSVERMAQKALDDGICKDETVGALNRYIGMLWNQGKNADKLRIYGEYIFLFKGSVLITVMELPNRFKHKNYIKKRECDNEAK